MTTQPRQPAGTPVGGEYTTKVHVETGTTLGRPYANATPPEVDGRIASLVAEVSTDRRRINSYVESAHYMLGHPPTARDPRGWHRWAKSTDDNLTELEKAINNGKIPAYNVQHATEILNNMTTRQAKVDGLLGRIDQLDDEFQARPWSRFFLVTSSTGGHIHASQGCHTCRDTTEYAWLPDLSGKNEPDAVAEHGAILCTACYPSAPVEWTQGKIDPDTCPGSNQPPAGGTRRLGRSYYGTCPSCGVEQIAGYSGIRKHKTAK